jgi:hypothetical protein
LEGFRASPFPASTYFQSSYVDFSSFIWRRKKQQKEHGR